jgi:hypothetical protein
VPGADAKVSPLQAVPRYRGLLEVENLFQRAKARRRADVNFAETPGQSIIGENRAFKSGGEKTRQGR